jgi:hypothetical protein
MNRFAWGAQTAGAGRVFKVRKGTGARADVMTAALMPGSCADERSCLDAGEVDFSNFCASS